MGFKSQIQKITRLFLLRGKAGCIGLGLMLRSRLDPLRYALRGSFWIVRHILPDPCAKTR